MDVRLCKIESKEIIDFLLKDTREIHKRRSSNDTLKLSTKNTVLELYISNLKNYFNIETDHYEIWTGISPNYKNFHFDCDEVYRKESGNLRYPVASTVTYLSDTKLCPTILLSIDEEVLKYKEYGEDTQICLSPCLKGNVLYFNPKYYHSHLPLHDSPDNNDRTVLLINFWNKLPNDLKSIEDDALTYNNNYTCMITQQDIPKHPEYTSNITYGSLLDLLYETTPQYFKDLVTRADSNGLLIFTGNEKYKWKTEEKNRVTDNKTSVRKAMNELLKTPVKTLNRFYQRMLTESFLPFSQCDAIINAAELEGKMNGWTTKRHVKWPTTDIPFKRLNKDIQFLVISRASEILNGFFKLYQLPSDAILNVNDVFVVKYLPADQGQACLGMHVDGSFLSFQIALSNPTDYEGGGTEHCDGIIVKPNKGDLIHHCGCIEHGGRSITKGIRYILVGFVDLIV